MEAVYHYLVPILSKVTDNLLFLNQRKEDFIFQKIMCRMQGVILRPLAYEVYMLPTELPDLVFNRKKIHS